jgi:hypothetical protein
MQLIEIHAGDRALGDRMAEVIPTLDVAILADACTDAVARHRFYAERRIIEWLREQVPKGSDMDRLLQAVEQRAHDPENWGSDDYTSKTAERKDPAA